MIPNPLDATPIGLPLRILGFFTVLPRWVYVVLAVAGLVGLGLHLHGNAVKRAYAAAYNQGVIDMRAAYVRAQAKANAQANAINSPIRKNSDEEARHIARSADDLRLRGPGKAACPGVTASRAAASGHVARGRPADAPVAEVPDRERPDLIAVPFAELIDFAERADRNRSEVLSWRESDRRQAELANQSQPKE